MPSCKCANGRDVFCMFLPNVVHCRPMVLCSGKSVQRLWDRTLILYLSKKVRVGKMWEAINILVDSATKCSVSVRPMTVYVSKNGSQRFCFDNKSLDFLHSSCCNFKGLFLCLRCALTCTPSPMPPYKAHRSRASRSPPF